MSTIRDIARIANVSISTVSRALNGNVHVDDATRALVLKYASELNYHPNPLAQGLKMKQSHTIAYLIPNIENLIYPSLAIAIELEARLFGYSVLLCNTLEDSQTEKNYVEQLKSRFVDGFIFSTARKGSAESKTIMDLKEEGYPCVCLMRMAPDQKDSVVVDNYCGACQGTQFLLQNQFKKIAFITGQDSLCLYDERYKGYLDTLNANGLEADPRMVWPGFKRNTKIAYSVVKEKIAQGIIPDAIFASSDPIAIDCLRAIIDSGLKVPSDISLMGFDNISIAELFNPALTTMEQPFYEMGRFATRMLISQISKREKLGLENKVFPTKIVIRESVKLHKDKEKRG